MYRRLSRITRINDITDFKKELIDRYGKLPQEAENMLLKIMLRVYCIKVGVKKLDLNPNALTITFSDKHLKHSLDTIEKSLRKIANYSFVKKDSVKIQLGRKRNKISKALLETRNILKAI